MDIGLARSWRAAISQVSFLPAVELISAYCSWCTRSIPLWLVFLCAELRWLRNGRPFLSMKTIVHNETWICKRIKISPRNIENCWITQWSKQQREGDNYLPVVTYLLLILLKIDFHILWIDWIECLLWFLKWEEINLFI